MASFALSASSSSRPGVTRDAIAHADSYRVAASAPPEPPPRFVFIDGGARLGGDRACVREEYPLHETSVVHCLLRAKPSSYRSSEAAGAHTARRGHLDEGRGSRLSFAEEGTLGGSVVASVIKVAHMKTVKVHAIDFPPVAGAHLPKDDVVYLKFDIEGAEVSRPPQDAKGRTMALIDRLYIEFHGEQQATAEKASRGRIVDVKRGDNELIEAITGLAIPIA